MPANPGPPRYMSDRAEVADLWAKLDDVVLRRHKKTVEELIEQSIEIGALLAEVKRRLRGCYLREVKERYGWSADQCRNYILFSLHSELIRNLAREHPALNQWHLLDLAKRLKRSEPPRARPAQRPKGGKGYSLTPHSLLPSLLGGIDTLKDYIEPTQDPEVLEVAVVELGVLIDEIKDHAAELALRLPPEPVDAKADPGSVLRGEKKTITRLRQRDRKYRAEAKTVEHDIEVNERLVRRIGRRGDVVFEGHRALARALVRFLSVAGQVRW